MVNKVHYFCISIMARVLTYERDSLQSESSVTDWWVVWQRMQNKLEDHTDTTHIRPCLLTAPNRLVGFRSGEHAGRSIL